MTARARKTATPTRSVLKFWKAMMAKYGAEKEYNRQIINGFKNGDDPEIIIVVDKLLTVSSPAQCGPLPRPEPKEHTLLQAIARVNRLHPGKDFGYIIDYYGVVTELHEGAGALQRIEGKFDLEDLTARSPTCRGTEGTAGLHDALWDLFRGVRNKKDEEAFELALEQPEAG